MDRAQPLLTEGPLHLAHLEGKGDTLVLSFAGIGLPGEAVQGAEAARMAGESGKNHVLFIADASRSWMNGPGIVEGIRSAVANLCDRIKPRRLLAVGNSMGGSSALIFAGLHPVDAVLALSPQYSVCPTIVPWETRWDQFTKQIADWRFPTCPDLSQSQTRVVILHGRHPEDRRHANLFRQGPSLSHYLFRGQDHLLAHQLKKRGLLQPIFSAFIAGDQDFIHRAIAAAGGQSLDDYHQSRRAAKAARTQEA